MAASSLSAADTIYTWGYGQLYNDVLLGVADMVSGADLSVKIAALIGFMVMLWKVFSNDRSNPIVEFGKFLLMSLFIYVFFLTPVPGHNTYNISDETTGTAYTVNGVPPGIGKTLSIFSTVEYKIALALEKHYSTPATLNYSKHGFGFALSGHNAISKAKPTDQYTAMNMYEYMNNCLVFALDEGTLSPHQVFNSSNLLSAINVNDNARMSIVYSAGSPEGQLKTCSQAYAVIAGGINGEVANMYQRASSDMGYLGANLQADASSIGGFLFGAATSANQYITQAATANLLSESMMNTAKLNGVNTASLAYGTALAERQQQNNFLISGQLAQKWLPIIKGIVTIVFLAMSWIMALMAIAFFNFKFILLIFSTQLWLMMWTPISSILNYIAMIEIESIGSGLTSFTNGYSYEVKHAIDNEVTGTLAWVGSLYWLVPLIAYGIAKGSDYAFTQLATSFQGAAQGAASSASSEMTRGNYSMGNVSTGKYERYSPQGLLKLGAGGWESGSRLSHRGGEGHTARQYESKSTFLGEDWQTTSTPAGGGAGTSFTVDNRGNLIGSNASISQQRNWGQAYQKQISDARTEQRSITNSQAETIAAVSSYAHSDMSSNGTTESSGTSKAVKEAVTQVEQEAFEKAYSESEEFRDTIDEKFGASLGMKPGDVAGNLKKLKGAKLFYNPGGNMGVSIGSSHIDKLGESQSEKLSSIYNNTYMEEMSNMDALVEANAKVASGGSSEKYDKSFAEAKQASKTWNELNSKIESATVSRSELLNTQSSDATRFHQWVADTYTDGDIGRAAAYIDDKTADGQGDELFAQYVRRRDVAPSSQTQGVTGPGRPPDDAGPTNVDKQIDKTWQAAKSGNAKIQQPDEHKFDGVELQKHADAGIDEPKGVREEFEKRKEDSHIPALDFTRMMQAAGGMNALDNILDWSDKLNGSNKEKLPHAPRELPRSTGGTATKAAAATAVMEAGAVGAVPLVAVGATAWSLYEANDAMKQRLTPTVASNNQAASIGSLNGDSFTMTGAGGMEPAEVRFERGASGNTIVGGVQTQIPYAEFQSAMTNPSIRDDIKNLSVHMANTDPSRIDDSFRTNIGGATHIGELSAELHSLNRRDQTGEDNSAGRGYADLFGRR